MYVLTGGPDRLGVWCLVVKNWRMLSSSAPGVHHGEGGANRAVTPSVALEAQDSLSAGGHPWPDGTHTRKARSKGFQDSALSSLTHVISSPFPRLRLAHTWHPCGTHELSCRRRGKAPAPKWHPRKGAGGRTPSRLRSFCSVFPRICGAALSRFARAAR